MCRYMKNFFYIELEEAIARDAKREGKACVGRTVIEKWWKESGKSQFRFSKPRVGIFFLKEHILLIGRLSQWFKMKVCLKPDVLQGLCSVIVGLCFVFRRSHH